MVSYDEVTMAIASFMRVAEKVFHPRVVNQTEHSESLRLRDEKSERSAVNANLEIRSSVLMTTQSDMASEKTSERVTSRPIARMPIHPSMRGKPVEDQSSLPAVWRTDKGDPVAYSAQFLPWADPQGTVIEKYRDENGARRARD